MHLVASERFLQKKRRKAPGFIRGDVRRALDFVFVFVYCYVDIRLQFWYNYIVKVLKMPSERYIQSCGHTVSNYTKQGETRNCISK